MGILYSSFLAYQQMLKQKSGHIFNVSSIGGIMPQPMASAYAATKHAVFGLSTSIYEEAYNYGIKVSIVCPGIIKTSLLDNSEYTGDIDKDKLKTARENMKTQYRREKTSCRLGCRFPG